MDWRQKMRWYKPNVKVLSYIVLLLLLIMIGIFLGHEDVILISIAGALLANIIL